MAPTPSSASGELWGHHWMPEEVCLDILMPNGIYVALLAGRESTLETIKEDAWREAKRLPLFLMLQLPSAYVFTGVIQEGKCEEFFDESRRLCDLLLFLPVLQLAEPLGNLAEKRLNHEISTVIGHPLSELEEIRDPEIVQFRLAMLQVCQDAITDRQQADGKDLYCFPSDVCSTESLSEDNDITRLLPQNSPDIMVCIWVSGGGSDAMREQKTTLKVSSQITPDELICLAIKQKGRKLSVPSQEGEKYAQEHGQSYLLKVAGYQLYLFEQCALIRYGYIRKCILERTYPQLMLMSKRLVLDAVPAQDFVKPHFTRRQTLGAGGQGVVSPITLWDLEGFFSVNVISASSISSLDADQLYVKIGIYHGPDQLYEKDTKAVPYTDPRWNESLEFDQLYVKDIPLAAQVCIALCSIKNRKQKQGEHSGIGWANVRIVDFRDCVLTGRLSLHLWPYPKGFDAGMMNPLGHNGSNPQKDGPRLDLEFAAYDQPVIFPPIRIVKELVAHINRWGGQQRPIRPFKELSSDEMKLFEKITGRDALHEMSEQEKDFIWSIQLFCATIPDSLPRLLDSVKWASRAEVAQICVLLDEWKEVHPRVALELLDIKYPDRRVREFAVRCLTSRLSDEQLGLYIISLVQALKYEPFMDCALVRYLLKRALMNQRIGHQFFWLMRSEMSYSVNWQAYAFLLEAFCRGIGAFIKSLRHQVEAVEKLSRLTTALKERKDEGSTKLLQDKLAQADCLETLQHFECPIDNSVVLADLISDECKVIDSAKRPLWLVWKNSDPLAHVIRPNCEIIFKSGDDLRQDMLTMQVMKIMDIIWRQSGKNFRLTPYTCMSMGKMFGMIEVVRNSKTIFDIQRLSGRVSALSLGSTVLHKWIKEHNKGEKYEAAIENFTYSCAGYCVATFILGIKDRHPGNIMITEDGHIFHIDFGHFLGHYKTKFGINRERVPFVLTDSFLRVIAKGAEDPLKTDEFRRFVELCCDAYTIMRKNSNLFITLFTMMLCMGLPELQKIDDISYLRRTLAVEKTENEAVKYFMDQMTMAHRGEWTTKNEICTGAGEFFSPNVRQFCGGQKAVCAPPGFDVRPEFGRKENLENWLRFGRRLHRFGLRRRGRVESQRSGQSKCGEIFIRRKFSEPARNCNSRQFRGVGTFGRGFAGAERRRESAARDNVAKVINMPTLLQAAQNMTHGLPLRLDAAVFGSDDFCASIGAQRSKEANELLYARQYFVTVCKAFGLQAIDIVFIDYKDLDGLKKQCVQAAQFGFTGKQVIHPAQVPIVQEAFLPSKEKIEWAKELLEEFKKQESTGKGAITFRGMMIDAPLVLQAKNIVQMIENIQNE